jgi:hypothetical protein
LVRFLLSYLLKLIKLGIKSGSFSERCALSINEGSKQEQKIE